MVLSFRLLNRSALEQIIVATSNPFTSLFIGLLLTALIQSSSTTTTMLVAMVASGTTTLENAVFMVMGANIGTTVTSTFVSLGHLTKRKEFRKAIAVATVHDFFNILTAAILLPLEYYFGLLSRLALWLASFFTLGSINILPSYFNLSEVFLFPVARFFHHLVLDLSWIGLLLSVVMVFVSIRYIGILLKTWVIDTSPNLLEDKVFNNPLRSLGVGIFFTGIVQSSSLVSSLVVPIVASNRLSIKKAFPFIMGANIGTTLTALLAAVSESEAAISIALAHVLFNLIGVLIFFPIPYLRNIPVAFARYLGKSTLKNRIFGLFYIVIVFFIVPFILIFASKGKVFIKHYEYYPLQEIKIKNNRQKPYTLIYKVSNIGYTYPQQTAETRKIRVEESGDTLFLNKEIFLHSFQKDCWQGTDQGGRYLNCLTRKASPYQLNSGIRSDTVHIYLKRYIYTGNKNTYKFYLDLKKRILLKQQVWNEEGKLIYQEELIAIFEE